MDRERADALLPAIPLALIHAPNESAKPRRDRGERPRDRSLLAALRGRQHPTLGVEVRAILGISLFGLDGAMNVAVDLVRT